VTTSVQQAWAPWPQSEWRSCLDHAEKIGLGTRDYELILVK